MIKLKLDLGILEISTTISGHDIAKTIAHHTGKHKKKQKETRTMHTDNSSQSRPNQQTVINGVPATLLSQLKLTDAEVRQLSKYEYDTEYDTYIPVPGYH